MKCRPQSGSGRGPSGAAYLSSIRFHQSFILPANLAHGRPSSLRVSYCDLDYRDAAGRDTGRGDFGPTLLFLPGAGERRYYGALWADALARKHKVRYIHPDRFGVGGTGEVPLQWRIESFVDLVGELLKHLDIKHVALACHSAGAIYTFNTILRLRHVLHPEHPFVCFMTPWVLPKHSKAFVSRATCLLPSAVIRRSHLIDQAVPLVVKWLLYDVYTGAERLFTRVTHHGEYSRIRRLRKRLSHRGKVPAEKLLSDDDDSSVNTTSSNPYATEICPRDSESTQTAQVQVPSNENSELDFDFRRGCEDHACSGSCIDSSLYLDCMFAENSIGVGDDLLLCLKRKGVASWGLFLDYQEAIELLRLQETELLAKQSPDKQISKLKVKTFFAQEDSLIGDRGAAWFENLWMGQEEWVEYHSESKEGLGHDEIPAKQSGCMEWIMQEIAKNWGTTVDVEIYKNRNARQEWSRGW